MQSLQAHPEVIRAARSKSVLVIVPCQVPIKHARHEAMHEKDPVVEGNHRDWSVSGNSERYRLVLLLETCSRKTKMLQLALSLFGDAVIWRWLSRPSDLVTWRDGLEKFVNIATVRFSHWANVLGNICKILFFVPIPFLKLEFASAYQTSCNSYDPRTRCRGKPFSRWRPSTILNF